MQKDQSVTTYESVLQVWRVQLVSEVPLLQQVSLPVMPEYLYSEVQSQKMQRFISQKNWPIVTYIGVFSRPKKPLSMLMSCVLTIGGS